MPWNPFTPSIIIDGQYAVDTLPAANQFARRYAWVTDLHDGQPDYVISDGVGWKPVRPLAVRDMSNPTSMTLQALKNSPTQRIKTMNVSPVITFSTDLAYGGAKFRVFKPASALLTVTLGGLVNVVLPGLTAQWADMEYSVGDGGWVQTASGGLL